MELAERGSPTYDLVVIGTSAGGVAALKTIAGGLPADFPGSVLIVIHTAPDAPGMMPQILDRVCPLPVRHPENGAAILPGHVYVAPPDHHLIVRDRHLHLSRGPSENGSRPAVNPLFRSAARAYGARVVGVVLTGTLDDGTGGLITIEELGGVTIVQDPSEADFRGMPDSALQFVDVDHVLPVGEIAACLNRLARRPIEDGGRMTQAHPPIDEAPLDPNAASGLSCPECHGSLWEVCEGEMTEYRCRIGHIYSPESLLHALGARSSEELESTVRSLYEEAEMADRLVERALQRGMAAARVQRYRTRATAARARAEAVDRAVQVEGGGEEGEAAGAP